MVESRLNSNCREASSLVTFADRVHTVTSKDYLKKKRSRIFRIHSLPRYLRNFDFLSIPKETVPPSR